MMDRIIRTGIAMILIVVLLAACTREGAVDSTMNWYKGNTHTHSFWSDGDAAPEIVSYWYRSKGYNFLVLTEHDILLRGEKWVLVGDDGRIKDKGLEELRVVFGKEWIVEREMEGRREMRLKTLQELREYFEVPGEFLFIEGEEISDSCQGKPLHFNALNLAEHIPTQGGGTIEETVRRNIIAVNEQAARLNRPILVHINHSNWKWALTPEQLASEEGTHLFELYNGSTGCNNYGDETHPGMDEVWDIALTLRLTELELELMYGIATDDTHNYHAIGEEYSHPGRGWIMVRARNLTIEEILESIRKGDFYSSTGVELEDVRQSRSRYLVQIKEEEGIKYTVQFIGTRIRNGIIGSPGEILKETTNNPASYRYRGDELYVRAKVISSRMQESPAAGEAAPEYAWTQPVVPKKR